MERSFTPPRAESSSLGSQPVVKPVVEVIQPQSKELNSLTSIPSNFSQINATINSHEGSTHSVNDVLDEVRRINYNNLTMVNRGKDLPDFDPQKDDVHLWIFKIQNQVSFYNWSEEFICQIIPRKLRGAATEWYQSLFAYPKLWLEWQELLIKTFPPVRDLHTLIKTMMDIIPRTNESLFNYCFRKLSAIRALNLNLSGKDEVSLIVGGLLDDNLKFSIRSANILDAESLAAYLKSITLITIEPNVLKTTLSNGNANDRHGSKNL